MNLNSNLTGLLTRVISLEAIGKVDEQVVDDTDLQIKKILKMHSATSIEIDRNYKKYQRKAIRE